MLGLMGTELLPLAMLKTNGSRVLFSDTIAFAATARIFEAACGILRALFEPLQPVYFLVIFETGGIFEATLEILRTLLCPLQPMLGDRFLVTLESG